MKTTNKWTAVLSKWWFWIIIAIIALSITTAPTKCPTTEDCPDCSIVAEKYYALQDRAFKICELYNMEVNLVNDLSDYVDEYANPTNVLLERQILADCHELVYVEYIL